MVRSTLGEQAAMRLVGLDGCRAGWVAAECDVADTGAASLPAPTFTIERSFGAVLAGLQGRRALIAVDIPIGLPSGAPLDTGRRDADRAARSLLGSPRATSVFSAPCRPTLTASSYRDACRLEVHARGGGTGLSQQTYNIVPKIREVDAAIVADHQSPVNDAVRVWVREVHPEVTFAVLSPGGRGLSHPKRGCRACRAAPCPDADARVDLLRRYVPSFDPTAVRTSLLRTHRDAASDAVGPPVRGVAVGRDDVIDAIACLVSALRIVQNRAMTLPTGAPHYDARGLRMEIVA